MDEQLNNTNINDEPIETTETNDVVSMPDIPMPTAAKPKGIKDEMQTTFQYCFVGAGQGGSRIAEMFYSMGYRRVCVVNSTQADLENIDVPNKLAIGSAGSGKDLDLGRKYAEEHKEDILDLYRRSFDIIFDRVMICVGAGGGTGAGSLETLINVSNEWIDSCGLTRKNDKPSVGVIVALPQRSEGRKPNKNAFVVLNHLLRLVEQNVISPLIVIDNQRINQIYPETSITNFWSVANKSICSMFHLFNVLASKESSLTTFDKQDYDDVLSSGVVSFGVTALHEPENHTSISAAIRHNLQNNILSGGFDLKTGTKAGCVFVGRKQILERVPQSYLDHGFESLTRMLSSNSTVHQGIYFGSAMSLAVYTMIGGLHDPIERLKELSHDGGVTEAYVDLTDDIPGHE